MSAPDRTMPDPATEPTISVERGAAVAGVGRRSGYDAVHRGDWPSIRVGQRIVLPTRRWLDALGLGDGH